MDLWKDTPGLCEEVPAITPYLPADKKSDAAVVIFPGGGYRFRAAHEGEGYANFFAENGITAFSVDYRVFPHCFPLPLLDARRAVRFVRAHAAEYGIDPKKIAVMGSSAGGQLAAMVSTYREPIAFENIDETDREDYLPNAQILCYPVLVAPPQNEEYANFGTYDNLLGGRNPELEVAIDPVRNVTEQTPPAFIWQTANDQSVHVINSYVYATELRRHNVPTELHIFPDGKHGLGVAADYPHVAQWTGLLLNWLRFMNWL